MKSKYVAPYRRNKRTGIVHHKTWDGRWVFVGGSSKGKPYGRGNHMTVYNGRTGKSYVAKRHWWTR